MTFQNEKVFWDFMLERELIRLRRAAGYPQIQWTNDPIFQLYSFTNIKRHHDRTTALLESEFYDHRLLLFHPKPEALLNAAIFRYFGTIQSARANGWHTEWNGKTHADLVTRSELRMANGETIFTSAYIVPSCGSSAPKHEVVAHIIDGVWARAERILDTNSWAEACREMSTLWGVGSFMAKEVLLDYILATEWTPEDWTTWTPVGPGGRRGAGFVRDNVIAGIKEAEALEVIRELYSRRGDYWPTNYVDLDLTDIQFQLCEVAKYMKAKTGIGRPKRRFHPTFDKITTP